jgi:hypothetical protein
MEHVPLRSPIPREELHDRLRAWHADADDGDTVRDEAVADEDTYDGEDWVWVKYMGNRYCLDAGSTREGVGEYLARLATAGESIRWQAAPGEVVSVSGAPIDGFVLVRAP